MFKGDQYKVVIAGGSGYSPCDDSPTWRKLTDVEVYDSATGAWSRGPAIPKPLSHMMLSTLGGDSVILTGGGGADSSLNADIYRLPWTANCWTEMTKKLPVAKRMHLPFVGDDHMLC